MISKKLATVLDSFGVWLIFILIFVVLSFLNPNFLTANNQINVIRQIVVNAVIALGVTFVVSCGLIDLSTGAVATFSGIICCYFIVNFNWNIYLAMAFALLSGAALGMINGIIITKLNVQAFIATLGMQYILRGVVLVITQASPVIGLPREFSVLGQGYIGFIPIPVVILIIVFIATSIMFKYTSFGRNVLSTGENVVASRLSGINVTNVQILVCILSGLLAALGGIVLASRMNSGQPTSGANIPLQVMAAVFVGGTTLNSTSGKGVHGTLAGALIVGYIANGLNLMKVNSYWQDVALGTILILAVVLNNSRTKLKK